MSAADRFNFEEIISQFQNNIDFSYAIPFGSGHINDTFLIHTAGKDDRNYILQRINHNIFTDVPGLMNNIGTVSEHIRSKLKSGLESDFRPEFYTFLKTSAGENYYKDLDDNFWRMSPFVEESRSFDLIDTPRKAYNGGEAYGEFLLLLGDLSPQALIETIPNFHNVQFRLDNLNASIQRDPLRRVRFVEPEILFIERRSKEMKQIHEAGQKEIIPLRITHNDTKFNNIIFDADEKVIGVVDLDTVMPGYVHFDFGDAIRTGASTAEEDEQDPNRMEMDITLFEAFSKGFFSKTRPILTKAEIAYLPLSAKVMSYIMAVRFLTDYICGDTYYKISYREHNLHRTQAQLKLLKSMEEQYDTMIELVDKLVSENGE